MNLLVKNASIVTGEEFDSEGKKIDKIVLTDILIKSGKIKLIEKNISAENFQVIDAQGKLVLPGIVDAHTHMRDPGLSYKEDFISGSKAACRGGVTTFLDMPNTLPLTSSEETLKDKRENSLHRSYVDYGFHFGGVKSDNSKEIEKVRDCVASTKIFFNESTGDMLIEDNKTVENLFNSSRIIAVHAEGEKIREAIEAAKKFGKPLYLCHLSTGEEVEILKAAKKEGVKVYGEVTPHHLMLNENDRESSDRNRMLLRMKPELKTSADNEYLWKALADGIIDTVGTDHAPHTLEDKSSKVTFGIPGVENSLEMMLKGYKAGKITLHRMIQVMSENPAEIFNIRGKGKIAEGFDGDLILLDLKDSSLIKDEDSISKCGWSPYHGIEKSGTVETTILRGNIIYNKGIFSTPLIGEEIKYS